MGTENARLHEAYAEKARTFLDDAVCMVDVEDSEHVELSVRLLKAAEIHALLAIYGVLIEIQERPHDA